MVAVMRPPWGIRPDYGDDWDFLNEFSEGEGLASSQPINDTKNHLEGWFAVATSKRASDGHPGHAVLMDVVNLELMLRDVVKGRYQDDRAFG